MAKSTTKEFNVEATANAAGFFGDNGPTLNVDGEVAALLTGEINDAGDLRVARIDSITNSLMMIEYEHHEIHSGSSFSIFYENITTSDDDHRTAIGFQTPNTTKWLHMIIEIAASDPADFDLLEAPTITGGNGTEQTVYNRNRNSSTTSTVLNQAGSPVAGSVTTYTEAEIADATFSGGTSLSHTTLVGGSGPKAVGGSTRGSQEWILKQNTKYILLLQNVGAAVNTHTIAIDWYEHTNKTS